MGAEGTIRPAHELADLAARARSWSRTLRADAAKVARQVADTEEALAETLGQLASQHPRHADELRARSALARKKAARREREHQCGQPPDGSGLA
jgi:hypothetical protein